MFTHSEWGASRSEPELWETNENGVKHLIYGGLHYGHLQMDFVNTPNGTELTLSPVYIFPILDDNYDLVKTERRVYDDIQTVYFDKKGNMVESLEECDKPGNGKGKAIGICKDGKGDKGNGQKNGNPPKHSNAQKQP